MNSKSVWHWSGVTQTFQVSVLNFCRSQKRIFMQRSTQEIVHGRLGSGAVILSLTGKEKTRKFPEHKVKLTLPTSAYKLLTIKLCRKPYRFYSLLPPLIPSLSACQFHFGNICAHLLA